jgi:hypothetical protein
VTEQLRTVQQQIAEFHVLERQLAQVLHRLQTTAPTSHATGCQCLGSGVSEEQERHPLSLSQKGEAMSTSALDPFTILPPSALSETASPGDERCGCGCGCGASLTQFALPLDTADREKVQPARS